MGALFGALFGGHWLLHPNIWRTLGVFLCLTRYLDAHFLQFPGLLKHICRIPPKAAHTPGSILHRAFVPRLIAFGNKDPHYHAVTATDKTSVSNG